MGFMKLSLCLIIVKTLMMVTFVNASRHGEKIHFHDSSELGEFNIDERPGHGRSNRNHRGRGRGVGKQDDVPEFEQGLPGVYPIKGPPQAPLELPTHPGRGIGLQKHIIQQHQQQQRSPTQTPNNLYAATNNQPLNHPPPYAANPFLSKIQIESTVVSPTTTAKNYPPISAGVINQSTSLDKTTTTTTPSYLNPRRIDLFYGSNLLEEEQEAANRKNKAEENTEINFDDRGLFYSEPRCPPGQILVKTKCRMAV